MLLIRAPFEQVQTRRKRERRKLRDAGWQRRDVIVDDALDHDPLTHVQTARLRFTKSP
jgi:hypothetical protein